MNIVEVSEHIGECLVSLTEATYTKIKAVILIHGDGNDLSMLSNFEEQQDVFEVLIRGMVASFGPEPTGPFQLACHHFAETIKPTVETFSGAESVVCCFWDTGVKEAAILSSVDNRSVTFAIICEHIVRIISGEKCYSSDQMTSRVLH